jgi:hypothetical protein
LGPRQPKNSNSFFFKSVGSLEELLEFLHGSFRKAANVRYICLKRRTVGHSEDTIVPFFFAFRCLNEFENADGLAAKHDTRIGL